MTFYYPPDLSAGAYRASALVQSLVREGGSDLNIDVVTTEPNRYSSYSADAKALETTGQNVTLFRIPVPRHKSGFFDQGYTFAHFAWRAFWRLRNREYDLVIATTSRLFTGSLGMLLARQRSVPLYLDVRDLLTETVRDLVDSPYVRLLNSPLRMLQDATFRSATRMSVASPGFLEVCQGGSPGNSVKVFSNGIDAEFLRPLPNVRRNGRQRVIVYAGNIGRGQALEELVPEAARRLGPAYQFNIIGDGGLRSHLASAVRAAGVSNVNLIPPMNRGELIRHYAAADYLLLQISDVAAMERVLPSKIFEYGATGKPILAGVKGFAREFVEREVEGAAVFSPGDVDELLAAIAALGSDEYVRTDFRVRYSRDRIMSEMARDVLSILIK